MGDAFKEFAVYGGIALVIAAAVRPGSTGGAIVTAGGSALSNFAKAVTGQG